MRDQRMHRQIMLDHVCVNCCPVPIGKRIDLEAALLNLKARQPLTRFGLECLAPRKLCIKRRECRVQGDYLADLAAAIGIIRPAQPSCILVCDCFGVGCNIAQISQTNALNQRVTVSQRLRKMLPCFEEDYGHMRINAANQVEQHRAFRAKA